MSRTPLVLLHGWGMTPRIWDGLRAELPGTEALTPALPGHDGSASPGNTLRAWSDALLKELPEGCVLVGWSLGAMLALDLAARHPQRIRKLALIGATPRFVRSADWPHGLEAHTVATFTEGFAEAPEATLRRFCALQAVGGRQRRQVLSVVNDALADTEHAEALADGLLILADTDLRAHLADLATPTLLLHGRDDALMPLGAAQWLAQTLPHAQLQVFDDCGHAPFVTQNRECAQVLQHWLEHTPA